MTRYEFHFVKNPSLSDEFSEASIGELKILVLLYESGGDISEDELIEKSGLSKARVSSALALWEEAGVIAEGLAENKKEEAKEAGDADDGNEQFFNEEFSFYGNSVKDEFKERIILGELEEESAKDVALTIRNKGLSSLFDEIAKLMKKPMLTPQEIRKISELSSQYELSEEYIAMLAAHLAAKEKFSVQILVSRAMNIFGQGITSAEILGAYLSEQEKERKDLIEYKKIFGIINRKPSKKENDYLHKWSVEYGFGVPIVAEAYSFSSIKTSNVSFVYMDKILTDWHEHSCKTVEECRARYNERGEELKRNAEEKREAEERRRPSRKAEKPKKRYGEFDAEEAFKLALDRSFTSDGE